MKKILSMLLAAVLVFALCACGGTAAPVSGTPAEPAAPAAQASGNEFPSKNIAVIVPYAAGEGVDISARAVFDNIDLPVGVAFENIEGGGGSIATQEAFAREADGYTIVALANNPAVAQTLLNDSLTYDTTDWTVIAEYTERCSVAITSNPALGLADSNDLKEFLEAGNTFTCGVPSMNGFDYVAACYTFNQMGILDNVTWISYDSTANLYQAYLSGEIDLAAFDDNLIATYAQENSDVIVNATLGETKSVFFPELDCAGDWGVSGLSGNVGFKYFAVRSDTPAEVVDYLREKVVSAIETEAYQKWCVENNFGAYPTVYTADQSTDMLVAVKSLYATVFKMAGLID